MDAEMRAYELRDEVCENEYEREGVQVYDDQVSVWVGGWTNTEQMERVAFYIARGLGWDIIYDEEDCKYIIFPQRRLLEILES